jgi:hypothetical protein
VPGRRIPQPRQCPMQSPGDKQPLAFGINMRQPAGTLHKSEFPLLPEILTDFGRRREESRRGRLKSALLHLSP